MHSVDASHRAAATADSPFSGHDSFAGEIAFMHIQNGKHPVPRRAGFRPVTRCSRLALGISSAKYRPLQK